MSPTVYPCFYDETTQQLLTCASKANPSQRCPVGYDRVENTTNCRKQVTITPQTQTVQPTTPIIVSTPRTGAFSAIGTGIVICLLVVVFLMFLDSFLSYE
jgi:hypothetical protein